LASRLQGIAERNTVVVGESTQRLLASVFKFQDLGGRDLKGIARLVRAFVRRGQALPRAVRRGARGPLAELVSRDEEIELLLWCLSKVKSGDPRSACSSRGGASFRDGRPASVGGAAFETLLPGQDVARLRAFLSLSACNWRRLLSSSAIAPRMQATDGRETGRSVA
jgi:hypothetical protein